MMTRDHAVIERHRWARALTEIARAAGEKSVLYRMLGTVAWGRYDGEPTASGDTKDQVMFGLGFLQGVRYAALLSAEIHKIAGEDALRTIHKRIAGYEK